MTYTGPTEGLAVCDNCGKYVHTAAELRACTDSIVAPPIDHDRDYDEPCEKGTVGCCVAHRKGGPRSDTCETW